VRTQISVAFVGDPDQSLDEVDGRVFAGVALQFVARTPADPTQFAASRLEVCVAVIVERVDYFLCQIDDVHTCTVQVLDLLDYFVHEGLRVAHVVDGVCEVQNLVPLILDVHRPE